MEDKEKKETEQVAQHQKWLEAIMDAVPVPLFFTDPVTNQITFRNHTAKHGAFTPPSQIPDPNGMYYTEANGERVPNENMPRYRVHRGEPVKDLELIAHGKDKTTPILINGALVPAMHGHPATGLITFQDITERKRAEAIQKLYADVSKLLAESLDYAARFQALASAVLPFLGDWAMVDAIDLKTGQYRRMAVAAGEAKKAVYAEKLQALSPAGNAPEGAARALATGESIIFSTIPGTPHYRPSENCFALGTTDPQQLELIRSLGVSSYITVLMRARGHVLGAITLVRSSPKDPYTEFELQIAEELAGRAALLADNARLYEDSQAALANLQIEKEMREQFVMMFSHDLRTPLTAAKASAQLIARDPVRTDRLPHLAVRIDENLARADKMIQDLLDASRLSMGKSLNLQISEFELSSLITKVTDDFRSLHGDRIGTDLERDLVGHWSYSEIHRLFENLLSNALKHGEPETKVTLCAQREEPAAVLIKVHNVGCIPEEDQGRIFDQFFRARNATQANRRGWGLGLTIVQGIAHAHKGDVWLKSNANEGTTFFVRLPLNWPQ